MRKFSALPAGAVVVLLTGLNYLPAFAKKPADTEVRVMKEEVDTDNDGTISLEEADKAVSKRFAKLDTDNDGTLTFQEFQGSETIKPSKQEFEAMDPDHDGTVSQEEYMAAISKWFKKVDTDHDGTIDAKELRTAAGIKLQSLLL